jgi:2-oxoglutarate ferredoxin oxidoreductase subunit alpha
MRRTFDTGNAAITEGAILAGCRVFAGYPITPATEIAENMSRRLPQVGGFYVQTEDECAALHVCNGASLGGLKAMTATSGPGFILFSDPFGWAVSAEIPVVIVDAQRVGPVSGITGAPGQGELYLSRYLAHGGNYETIVLAPSSVQEAFRLTVRAFELAERFRTPVTILADQMVTDGWEALEVPETLEEARSMGLRVVERRAHPGPVFYPATDEIDLPPVVLGRGTGGACSDWTPTEAGLDTEVVEGQHRHAHRLIHKIRGHRDLIAEHEAIALDDAPELVLVAYGTPSRVMKSAVGAARARGLRVGGLRLVSLWPFPDELFARPARYLTLELNWDGQLVREVRRASSPGSKVHFLGKCGELPAVAEIVAAAQTLLEGRTLRRRGWEAEAW